MATAECRSPLILASFAPGDPRYCEPPPAGDILFSGETKPLDSYIAAEKSNIEGDEASCRSLSGIYQLQYTDNSTTFNVVISIRNMSGDEFEEDLPPMLPKEIVTLAYFEAKQGQDVHGLIVETTQGWEIIRASRRYTPKLLLEKYVNSRKRNQPLPQDITSREICFDENMELASGDNLWLKYDGVATIRQFTSGMSKFKPNTILNNHSVRVPPEMYELLDDPDFIVARNEGRFSAMMDTIFSKAKKLMDGDLISALFVCLLVTDMRERGPCGAVHGLRGLTVVPRSLFDHEQPTFFDPSRRDAAQHFFGYALSVLVYGPQVTSAYESLRKRINYYLPGFRNFFPGIGCHQTRRTFARVTERRKIDLRRDYFYDELGSKFAMALRYNPELLPSRIILSPGGADKRKMLGLSSRLDEPWMACDPNAEIPRFRLVPLPEKVPQRKLPAIAYESSASASSKPSWLHSAVETWGHFDSLKAKFLREKMVNVKVCDLDGPCMYEEQTRIVYVPLDYGAAVAYCADDNARLLELINVCENTLLTSYRELACGLALTCLQEMQRRLLEACRSE